MQGEYVSKGSILDYKDQDGIAPMHNLVHFIGTVVPYVSHLKLLQDAF